MRSLTAAVASLLACQTTFVIAQETRSADEIIESRKLPRLEPLTPGEAHDSFEVIDGFRVELVAAEPLVTDPVAFCFDGRGRLIVAEMRGYSERRGSHTGRVRRLTDTDGDGRMDVAETLIDGLPWPTAVHCWGDGIVVGVAPDILYVPPGSAASDQDEPQPGSSADADRDGARRWYNGFGTSNVQGLMNSFRWGPDLRLHGATSSSGGEITGVGLDQPLRLGRRDFAISPESRELSPVAGGGQHGMVFDRWGDKFVCSNSDHLQQVLMMPPRAGRAGRYADVPPRRRSIAADGPQADVYRISPVEPWRVLRTHLRVTGQAGGPVEGGGTAAGYFTGATGVHVYAGDQWAETEQPTALICDVGSNLVHRKRLQPDGLWYRGVRVDRETEFLRSPDTWFRPVQLGPGPDGALYIADMYREVIEHPKSLPPVIKSQVDLNSGNNRGRIWRVVAEDRPIRRRIEPLDELETPALVERLRHPNAWQRRTAARLLVFRDDRRAVAPLRKLAATADRPETRLEALAVLARRDDGLDRSTRDKALADPHPRVRQRAVELSADTAERLGVLNAEQSLRLSGDESIFVRFQLAYDSGVLIPDPASRAKALLRIASANPEDRWIRWAVEGSLGSAAPEFLEAMVHAGKAGDAVQSPAWLASVACQLLNGEGGDSVERLVAWLGRETTTDSMRSAMLDAIGRQVSLAASSGNTEQLSDWVEQRLTAELAERAQAGKLDPEADAGALKLVGWASPQDASRMLDLMLAPTQPPSVQRLALRTLVGNDREAAARIVRRLNVMTPPLRAEAFSVLASRRSGLRAIAAAMGRGELEPNAVPAEAVTVIRESNDAAIRRVAGQFEREPAGAADQTIASYAEALAGQGRAARGKATFKRLCAVCHRPDAGKPPVGPSLKSVVDKTPQQILLSILDPNREVDPKYYRVQLLTVDGRVVAGILAEETGQTLKLVDSQGKEHVVARQDVETLQTSNQSLMPSDLSKEISETAMRDLIVYLREEL